MEDKSLELLTPEQRKLHEEFGKCRTEEDFQRWDKKAKLLNESEANQRTRLDMTFEEFCQKYNTTSYEEMEKRMWGEMVNCESWTPSQWVEYLSGGETFDDEELDRFIEEEIIEK